MYLTTLFLLGKFMIDNILRRIKIIHKTKIHDCVHFLT